MELETLFFKDKFIHGTNVEIFFHKDYTYLYNIETFPVVKYTLYNCEDIASKKFESIDPHNDGVYIESREVENHFLFETIDLGGGSFQISCDKIIREEQEYRKEDFVDLIKYLVSEVDDGYEVTKSLHSKLDAMKTFLRKEIDLHQRKLDEAHWLDTEKKHLLQGELQGFTKALNFVTMGETTP